jgi:hypothetical protein
MSLQTLREEILREFREWSVTSPISVSATEVNMYINWGFQNLCMASKPISTSATTAVFALESTYKLPYNCMLPSEVYHGTKKLNCKQFWEKDEKDPYWRQQKNSVVSEYIPLSWNYIEISPKPTKAGTLTFYYHQMAATVTATVDSEFQNQDQRVVKDFVLAIMHAKARKQEISAKYYATYANSKNKLAVRVEELKRGDKGGSIRYIPRSISSARDNS